MCNPHPGKRCLSDSLPALKAKVIKLDTLVNAQQELGDPQRLDKSQKIQWAKNNEAIGNLSDEIRKAKVFLYASSAAQDNRSGTMKKVMELAPVSRETQKVLGNDEMSLYQTAGYLNTFQSVADAHRTSLTGEYKQLHNAREMYLKTFPAVYKAAVHKLENERDSRIAKALEDAGSDEPNNRTDDIEATYSANREALDDAFRYARQDAYDVVLKDIVANSKSTYNRTSGVTTNYRKNVDGSFTVATDFQVRGKDFGHAVEVAQDSFKLEDIQLSSSRSDSGDGYNMVATYLYNGGEKYEDARKFQADVFRPDLDSFRSPVLDDLKRVEKMRK